MSADQKPIAKLGILSLGDMGAGIARILIAHGYAVASNCTGRSQDTIERANEAGVELLGTDVELVEQCEVVFSVVPPRDADATADRIISALKQAKRTESLYFVDLNAVAPSTIKGIAQRFQNANVSARLVDGSILGFPPRLKPSEPSSEPGSPAKDDWFRPSIPISGPEPLTSLPYLDHLTKTLNLRTVSPTIGAASGLKMCFASMAKGFIGIATQAFTTAHSLGIADALRSEMAEGLPKHLVLAEQGVPGMPPKAYRWVREMEEIALTFREEGGWEGTMFDRAGDVYQAVADDPVLGAEKIGKRKRGTTVLDVAEVMSAGLESKKKKTEQ